MYADVHVTESAYTIPNDLSLRTGTHATYSPTARIVTNASTTKAKN